MLKREAVFTLTRLGIAAKVTQGPATSEQIEQTWHQHSNRTRSFRPLWIALLVEYPDEA